jgi:hypothetical protein
MVERVVDASSLDTTKATKNLTLKLEELSARLTAAAAGLDPVIRPASMFDPSDPVTAGRMVSLTLVAQQRYPLARVPEFYGAGVYALYYKGESRPFSAYRPLAGSDHPIYVGKADPDSGSSKSAVLQGRALAGRLREHAARIERVTSTLDIEDFECRFLIVQTGFQASAEDYLIRFFKPIWNSDTNICYGMSKHGDRASTRANGRSPWFTMHPGVKWADDPELLDQKPKAQIEDEIAAHFRTNPPYKDIHQIFDVFIQGLRQMPLPLTSEPVPPEPD